MVNHLVEKPVGLKLPKGLPLKFEENRKGGGKVEWKPQA
jgi:hypothetical protein